MTLNDWRDVLEPLIQESLTPMDWDTFLSHKMNHWTRNKSILVAHPSEYKGRPYLAIWLAHGDLADVEALVAQCEQFAEQNGFAGVAYSGRRGWVRALGFRELAIFAVKGFK